jgi:hypothetical protein
MISVLRHPALPIGVLLLILGIGNWLVSKNKLEEYSHRAASGNEVVTSHSLRDYPALNERTNRTLLERLHRGLRDYNFIRAKLDFYSVVRSGGRLLTAIGVFLIAIAFLHTWREQRLAKLRSGTNQMTAS